MIVLMLSEQEATALRQLIDAGVKAAGLSLARNAVVLDDKLMSAVQAAQEAKAKPKDSTPAEAPSQAAPDAP